MKYINYKSGIYKIVDSFNEILYVGQAVDFEKRYKQHLMDLKNKKHPTTELQKYADKVGIDSLSFVVVEPVRIDLLDAKELFYIKKMRPIFNYCLLDEDLRTTKFRPEQIDFINLVKTKNYQLRVPMDELISSAKQAKIKITPKAIGATMVKIGYVKVRDRAENNKTYYVPIKK